MLCLAKTLCQLPTAPWPPAELDPGDLGANHALTRDDLQYQGDQPNEINNLAPVSFGTGLYATAITAGHTHNCVILNNDKVKCWGWNPFGNLGLGDTISRGGSPNQLGDLLPFTDLGY